MIRYILRDDQIRNNLIDKLLTLDLDKPWEVVAKRYRKTRTGEQNAYLWGAVYPAIRAHIEATVGQQHSADDLHEFFKSKFNISYPVVIGGEEVIVATGTHDMTTVEFGEYLDKVIDYCGAKLGLAVPPPTTQGWMV